MRYDGTLNEFAAVHRSYYDLRCVYMSIADEFVTVDRVLTSGGETRAVDAFALSLIKAERQGRRLFTYLVYQHPWCNSANVPALKQALESSKSVYFEGVIAGCDALYSRSVEQLIGSEYKRLCTRLDEAAKHRNKIFHGQLTAKGLSRQELLDFVTDIRMWCDTLGKTALAEVGYDGFGRNSFRKAKNANALYLTYKIKLADLAAYRLFIKTHMER